MFKMYRACKILYTDSNLHKTTDYLVLSTEFYEKKYATTSAIHHSSLSKSL